MKSKFQINQINTMLTHLKLAFKCCNMYSDIKDLMYNPAKGTVDCIYYGCRLPDGGRETCLLEINVACDSYSAMIHDVEERLYKFFS